MVNLKCLADICLVPIGTGSASVSKEVTKVERLIRQSHLKSTLHSAGTTIEGPWDEVMTLIGQMHKTLHDDGILRVQSDVRIGTRIDKEQSAADKVRVVEEQLRSLNNSA